MAGCDSGPRGASTHARPHAVGAERLRLRFAIFADLAVPLAGPVTASASRRGSHQRTVELGPDGELSLSVLGSTTVLVVLAGPVEVDLGRLGVREVRRIRLYADDPDHAVGALSSPRG